MKNILLKIKQFFYSYSFFNFWNFLIIWLLCISSWLILLTRFQIRLAETGLMVLYLNKKVPNMLSSHLEFIWKKLYCYNFLLFDSNFFFSVTTLFEQILFISIVIIIVMGIVHLISVFLEIFKSNTSVIYYTAVILLVLYITVLMFINWDVYYELISINKSVTFYQNLQNSTNAVNFKQWK